MNNAGINTSVYANVVTPFSPVGRQAVGLENAEAKEEVLPPAEEPATLSGADNRDTENKEAQQALQREEKQRVEQQQQQQQQQDQQLIRELGARDREVRAHEQAHASVGGQYAGSPSFTFERGPDGVNYAVGGEVSISFPSGGSDPRQTLAAAEQVRRAALAPAEPSPQDRSVAAGATRLAAEARADIVELQAQEQQLDSDKAEQAQQEQQREQQAQQEQEAGERPPPESQQVTRRSAQLGEQLVTLDNVQSNQNIGSVVDQIA